MATFLIPSRSRAPAAGCGTGVRLTAKSCKEITPNSARLMEQSKQETNDFSFVLKQRGKHMPDLLIKHSRKRRPSL